MSEVSSLFYLQLIHNNFTNEGMNYSYSFNQQGGGAYSKLTNRRSVLGQIETRKNQLRKIEHGSKMNYYLKIFLSEYVSTILVKIFGIK